MDQAAALRGRNAGPGRRPGSGKEHRARGTVCSDLAGCFMRAGG